MNDLTDHPTLATLAPDVAARRRSSDGVNDITVYIGIGNSDNKLTQQLWARFVEDTATLVDHYAVELYGWWYSLPNTPWQNATCGARILLSQAQAFQNQLRTLAGMYNQDSIAWAQCERTVFLG